jgi:predicted nucleotidyltransferase
MDDLALPADVAQGLSTFVDAAKAALGPDLVAVVLFGSAAEGRLRATSDVNVIVVAERYSPDRLDALREPLRLAHALFQLQAMLLQRAELPAAAEAFAVKFADIQARHRVLHGPDLFATLEPTRAAMIIRLRQVLLNFILRTRERYALVSLRDEQLAAVVADSAGPLRSAAALVLQLEGKPAASPRDALIQLGTELPGGPWTPLLQQLSQARDAGHLPPGTGARTTLGLIDLAQALRERADRLS